MRTQWFYRCKDEKGKKSLTNLESQKNGEWIQIYEASLYKVFLLKLIVTQQLVINYIM